MFSAMHFIYYINRSITKKVDSTYLSHSLAAHNIITYMSLGTGGREPVTSRRLPDIATQVDKNAFYIDVQ